MAQLLVTTLFVVIMVGAARLIVAELMRPLVNQPNGFDDWLIDQLAAANDRVMAPTVAGAAFSDATTMRRMALA